jgi:adenylate kinase
MLGPPGAGKGTQARLLSERLGVPHISTGDVFRREIELGTELGKKAKELIDDGNLVGDDIVNGIVRNRISQPDAANGFILDGYPRTTPQAEDLDAFLASKGQPLSAVVDFEVDDEEIERRLSGRRVCSGCGASFHLTSIPPITPGKCDFCGSDLLHREDDKPEAIRRRLQVYRLKTQPLIDFYRERKKLLAVDARHGVERTFEAVCLKLGLDTPETGSEG